MCLALIDQDDNYYSSDEETDMKKNIHAMPQGSDLDTNNIGMMMNVNNPQVDVMHYYYL